METKNCQNCKKDFVIDERDALYYKKINVPHPTWCPQCRIVRRLSTHNVWSVYWRNCDMCKKRTLSMYNKDVPVKVYCNDCWWGDTWDGTEYGMDYDPNKNFFEQVYELSRSTPWVAQEVIAPTMINSEYCNGASYLRNCYLVFWADYCENIVSSSMILNFKDSVDCLRGYDSEMCYESIGFSRCSRTFFSEECDDCVDVWFSRDCYNCMNCVGCVNLRGESYCIFNKKYSKEEYAEKLKELNLDSWSALQEMKEKAYAFWLTKPYRAYHGHSLSINVTGDYVYESKNSFDMYIANGAEDSRYCQFITVPKAKDCYDYAGWGANIERAYEVHSSGENVSNVKFSYCAYTDSTDVEYSIWTIAGKNNFGCVNLKRKKYCILNKVYTKEEYEKLKAQIIEDMKKNPYVDEQGRTWTYGETFPLKQSFFGYNETTAMKFFPKIKEEVLTMGLTWYDGEQTEYNTTIEAQNLPEKISDTTEAILNEVIKCMDCNRGYKIAPLELPLLQKMGIPVPHTCQQCRLKRRFSRMDPMQLWKRECQKCGREVMSGYSPERKEIVYCEKCYQGEFV
ncbi:MAG: hypothetical protein QG566_153 [Patescibacteria group bacterium]|nr:hypothetical protein [Patescibacteria group bacterium]